MRPDRYTQAMCETVRRSLSGRPPNLPAGSAVLWRAFAELSSARGMDATGPASITFSEIEAWCRLSRTPLAPHHVETIRAMDAAFIEHFATAAKGETTAGGARKLPQRSKQALSPALFDAALG